MKHNLFFLSFIKGILLLLLLTSCGGDKKQEAAKTFQQNRQQQLSNSVSENVYYIAKSSHDFQARIEVLNESLIVKLDQNILVGKEKGEKTKYYDKANHVVYSIKTKGPESFKLRKGEDQLLWKVKLYDDKVKIASNEEMENPFEIKVKGEKIKVYQNGEPIGAIRPIYNDSKQLEVNEYVLRNFERSVSIGLFLIDELSDSEKVLLSAELLSRER